MKIKYKLPMSFIIFALLFILLSYIEHLYQDKLIDPFSSLESHTVPSLTALLETTTAARRASIKAVEYSMRGKPQDRDKAQEALQQLEQQIQKYLQLSNKTNGEEPGSNILDLKNNFIDIIRDYLSISEGPAIKQVFNEEEKLQRDRRHIIKAANNAIEQVPTNLKYDLLLIKSEARKVSIKLIEFTLRGQDSDRIKAEDAIKILINASSGFTRKATYFPHISRTISAEVDRYIETASNFLVLMSNRRNPVDLIYQKEESLHSARKELIKALYPLISGHYQMLEQLTHTTASQINWSSQLQLYTALIISLLAVIGAYILARIITTPLNKLNNAASQIGKGNLEVEIDIHSADEIGELAGSFQQMANDLKQQRDQLEQSISLRNKELEELRQAEKRLENAQQITHIGDWELHLPSNRLIWSDEIFRIFEIDQDKFGASYNAFLEAIHPDDRDKVSKAYEDSLKNQTPYTIEHRLLMKDGSVKYVVEKCDSSFSDDGTPISSLGTIQDITEQRHSESLSHRMNRMFDHSIEEIYIFDSENLNFLKVSRGAQENLGYSMQEMSELTPVDIKPDYTHEQFRQYIEPLRSGKEQQLKFETRHQRKDGSTYPVEVSLQYASEDVSPVYLAIIEDLTERQQIQSELESHHLYLEQQVEERTRQLQDSNRELEAFSYSVSHDLRSPLRSIDGFSLAIVEDYGDQLDDTGKDYLNRVRKAAQHMGLLIDELLELSRVNRVKINKQNLDLNKIARQTFDELKSNNPERIIELIMDENMQLQGDARLTGIIMDNLIGNAWKFTAQQQKARIIIKSLAEKPNVFYIKDNGVGFDMRHADKLFAAFQRLHQVSEFPGTGVGLATVQRIIHRHGGQIWAESEQGKGATFFFTLSSSTPST